jgi:lysozyme
VPFVIDIHNGRPEPIWRALKSNGVTGVFLKATEGATYRDKTSEMRAVRARQAGLRVGFYHFARPSGGDAALEAMNFCDWVKEAGGIQRRDFRPVLDLEQTNIPYGHLASWAREFNYITKAQLGIGPLFYSYSYFISKLKLGKPLGYGLWLANYGPNDGKKRPCSAPDPWKRVALHQFTSVGKIGSYTGDVSYYSPGRVRGLLAHPVTGLV